MKYVLKAFDNKGRELSIFSPSYEGGTITEAMKWFSERDFVQNNPHIVRLDVSIAKEQACLLLLDSNRGTYIPNHFAELYTSGEGWEGSESEDIEVLEQGEECEWYWEAWDSVLQSAECIHKSGQVYTLCQTEHGDLWALCVDDMDSEEKSNFGFDE